MPEVVAVVLDAAEGDAAEAVDLVDELGPRRRGHGVAGRRLDAADAVAGRVEGFPFQISVQGEIVEAAVGEAVSVGC